jgi:long-subunit acyl-CoA synthetase (AMP-forming)
MLSYWENQASTDEAIDRTGWMRTSDPGDPRRGRLRQHRRPDRQLQDPLPDE